MVTGMDRHLTGKGVGEMELAHTVVSTNTLGNYLAACSKAKHTTSLEPAFP